MCTTAVLKFSNLSHLHQNSTKEIKCKTGAMFEPATYGLLSYSLTECATRKLSNFLQIRTIKDIISKGSTSRNGGVPFPLKEITTP